MGRKVLTHCFRSLIWLALLHFQIKASPCPGTEPDACKVHQPIQGVSAWNNDLRATNPGFAPPSSLASCCNCHCRDADAAPETPTPLDQGERGSSAVADTTCSPPENDQTCGEEDSAHGLELPSTTPCESLLVIQAEVGRSNGAFQPGDSSRIALKEEPSYGSNGNPNSAMAEVQVQALNHQLPLQHGSETEQQGVCLPALEQAMMDESALNPDSSLLLLPTEMADQVRQDHECRPSTATRSDSIAFPAAQLRKGTNRPESGQLSRQHNDIPFAEILRSTAEGTMPDADSLKERGLGIDNKDISARGGFQAPAASSGGSVLHLAARNGDGGGAFVNIDSANLLQTRSKNSKKPESGAPSKGRT